jgi:hypothetical protein
VKNKIQSDDWGALVSIFDSMSSYVYFKSGYGTIKEHSNHFLVRTLGQYIDIPLSSMIVMMINSPKNLLDLRSFLISLILSFALCIDN